MESEPERTEMDPVTQAAGAPKPTSETTALEMALQSFTDTLRSCFRNETWDVVRSYAERAWTAGDFADASWGDVEARLRVKWQDPAAAVTGAPG